MLTGNVSDVWLTGSYAVSRETPFSYHTEAIHSSGSRGLAADLAGSLTKDRCAPQPIGGAAPGRVRYPHP
jgi:hypothetical protein